MKLVNPSESIDEEDPKNNLEGQVEIIKKSLREWRPTHEAMALRFGPIALGVLSLYPASEFVRKLIFLNKAQKFRRGSAFPMMVGTMISGSSVAFSQIIFVQNDILLGRTRCPVCVQTRAAGLQLVFGTFLPGLIAIAGVNHLLVSQSIKHMGIIESIMKLAGPSARKILAISAGSQLLLNGLVVSRMQSEWTFIVEQISKFDDKFKVENRWKPAAENNPK